MKITSISLKSLQPAVTAAVAIVIAYGLAIGSAQAGYIVTLQQVGPNVVATGTGAIDLTGLTFQTDAYLSIGLMNPSNGEIVTGSTDLINFGDTDEYSGVTGPTSFGSGNLQFASSGTGYNVGIPSAGLLLVPQNYISGTALSQNSIYNNATFSSLGVTPGTYEWTWGAGANQNLTLVIPASAVPDSGSTFVLLFLALGVVFCATRLRSLGLA